jgi:hypothetical protein
MVLHLSHVEGGFGVSFNCVTKDTAFYTTTSRFVTWIGPFPQERQELWLPKDDLRDSSSWSSPPLVLLRDLHTKLISQYDWKEVCAPSQSQGNIGASAPSQSQGNVGASARLDSQNGVSHQLSCRVWRQTVRCGGNDVWLLTSASRQAWLRPFFWRKKMKNPVTPRI